MQVSLKSAGHRSRVKSPVKTRRRIRGWLASEFAAKEVGKGAPYKPEMA